MVFPLTFVFSATLTMLLVPPFMVMARRIGAVDHGGYRKIHRQPIPRIGGPGIAVPLIGVALWFVWAPSTSVPGHWISVLLAGSAGMLALGLVDDIVGVRPYQKLLVQTITAAAISIGGCTIGAIDFPGLGVIELDAAAGVLVTVVWVVGLVNAVNFIDGIDGLAGAVGLIAAMGLAAMAAFNQAWAVAALCLALAGSLTGFMRFNFHPARTFLGDSGSMFLGFTLAVLALMGSLDSGGATLTAAPVLILGLPIFEITVSTLRRLLRGRSPFRGDQYHTHHRLLRRGLSQRQIVYVSGAVAVVFAAAGVFVGAGWNRAAIAAMPVCGAALLGFSLLAGYHGIVFEYANSGITGLVQCRERNRSYSSMAEAVAGQFGGQAGRLDEWLGLVCRRFGLRTLEIRVDQGGPAEPAVRLPRHKIRVASPDGRNLTIYYQTSYPMDDHETRDLSDCLAWVFEGTRLHMPAMLLRCDGSAGESRPAAMSGGRN